MINRIHPIDRIRIGLAVLVLVLVTAASAQQPAADAKPATATAAGAQESVALTPQEQLELNSVLKDVTIAQLQRRDLEAQYAKYRDQNEGQMIQAQRAVQAKFELIRKAHGLSDDYEFNGTTFVKKTASAEPAKQQPQQPTNAATPRSAPPLPPKH